MGLTAKQRELREGKLTASAVACLMEGDHERIYNLWLELTVDPDFSPPDFSDNWHVQLGAVTEQLNLDWFAKKHGQVTQRGSVLYHAEHDWAACTLDGWSEDHACPIECKHLIGYTPTPEAAAKYYPQMQWQMWITDAEQCAFSAIQGGKPPEVIFIPRDGLYIAELARRGGEFMEHVRNLTPPVNYAPVEGKAIVEAVVEYDMERHASADDFLEGAVSWLNTVAAAKEFTTAEKVLKKLCPEDGKLMFGFGIEITRNKAGALSIKERKKDDDKPKPKRKRS